MAQLIRWYQRGFALAFLASAAFIAFTLLAGFAGSLARPFETQGA